MKKNWLVRYFIYFILGAIILVSLGDLGLLNLGKLLRGIGNLMLFSRSLFPPDSTVLATLSRAMLETIEIALVGTVIGFFLSLPLAMLGNRILFPAWVVGAVRLVVGVIRTVPSLLWALVFVIAIGLGPAAGTLGVAFYTTGYLAKLYYEAFEGVDREVLEAVKSVGAGRLQLTRYAVLPESSNYVLSQFLFMFEYNIRASSIMGFVGAGGIGFYMLGYIQLLQYDSLMTTLLITLAVVLIIDQVSARLRTQFLASPSQVR